MLETISNKISFYYQRGVESAEIVDGERIRGKWADELSPYTGKTAAGEYSVAITDFVNCPPDAESIRKFTAKYGPLDQAAGAGERFTDFYLTYWSREQEIFRSRWRFLTTGPRYMAQDLGLKFDSKDEGMEGAEFRVLEGEEFRYRDGCLHYRCQHLLRFMELDLLTTPFGRLRLCANPKCAAPYFVAHDLRMRYCGRDECVTWGKRQSSLSYWHEAGSAARKKKRLAAKRKSSQATRNDLRNAKPTRRRK